MIVRDATPADAEGLAVLMTELGFPRTANDVRQRWPSLVRIGSPPLVVDDGGVLGCLTWHVIRVFHRPKLVGRITMLVVAAHARGRGLWHALVAAAEARLAERGCGPPEVTSNVRLADAHLFYERLGYEETSPRLARAL